MKTRNGYNHKAATVAEARLLRDGGWGYRQIARLLGVPHQTVMYWCAPGYAEKRMREQVRRRHAERLRALLDLGLTQEQAAGVMALDTGDRWTVGKVRYALGLDRRKK